MPKESKTMIQSFFFVFATLISVSGCSDIEKNRFKSNSAQNLAPLTLTSSSLFKTKELSSLPETGNFPFSVSEKRIIEVSPAQIPSRECTNKTIELEGNTIYYFKGDVVYSGCNNFKLTGTGSGSTVLFLSKDAPKNRLLFFHGGNSITVENMFFWGNAENRPLPDVASNGIPSPLAEFWSIDNLNVRKVRVEGAMSVGLATKDCKRGGIYDSKFGFNGQYMNKPGAQLAMGEVYHFLNEGVNLNNSDSFTVSNNEIYSNTGTGLAFYCIDGAVTQNMTVEFNKIFQNGRIGSPTAGIGLDAADGVIKFSSFKANEIYANNLDGIMTNGQVLANKFIENKLIKNGVGAPSGHGYGINLRLGSSGNTGANNSGSGNGSKSNCSYLCTFHNSVEFGTASVSPVPPKPSEPTPPVLPEPEQPLAPSVVADFESGVDGRLEGFSTPGVQSKGPYYAWTMPYDSQEANDDINYWDVISDGDGVNEYSDMHIKLKPSDWTGRKTLKMKYFSWCDMGCIGSTGIQVFIYDEEKKGFFLLGESSEDGIASFDLTEASPKRAISKIMIRVKESYFANSNTKSRQRTHLHYINLE